MSPEGKQRLSHTLSYCSHAWGGFEIKGSNNMHLAIAIDKPEVSEREDASDLSERTLSEEETLELLVLRRRETVMRALEAERSPETTGLDKD